LENIMANQKRKEKPQHVILTDTFRRYIHDGIWSVGSFIPTELVLCQQFSASRITVRRALETLALEGLIQRRPGKGTWVTDVRGAPGQWILSNEAVNYPYPPETSGEILRTESVSRQANPELLQGFDPAEAISRISLLRRLKETPFALAHTYVPSRHVDEILGEFEPIENNYIFLIVERLTGRKVFEVRDTFSATLAVGEAAHWLNVLPGAALFNVHRYLFDREGRLIQATELFSRPDLHKLTFIHTKENSQRHAIKRPRT
jgi:GntR family transcriptional regulator